MRIEKAHDKWFKNPRRRFQQLYDAMKNIKRGIQEDVILIDDNNDAIIGDENLQNHL